MIVLILVLLFLLKPGLLMPARLKEPTLVTNSSSNTPLSISASSSSSEFQESLIAVKRLDDQRLLTHLLEGKRFFFKLIEQNLDFAIGEREMGVFYAPMNASQRFHLDTSLQVSMIRIYCGSLKKINPTTSTIFTSQLADSPCNDTYVLLLAVPDRTTTGSISIKIDKGRIQISDIFFFIMFVTVLVIASIVYLYLKKEEDERKRIEEAALAAQAAQRTGDVELQAIPSETPGQEMREDEGSPDSGFHTPVSHGEEILEESREEEDEMDKSDNAEEASQ